MSPSVEADRLWRAAVALNRAAAAVSPSAAALPPLIFFTDPVRTPDPERIAGRLPPGAAVVYRSFGRPEAGLEARRLRDATGPRGVRLLIGYDNALAEAVAADGVHLPERALDRAGPLRRRRPGWLITGALHAAPTVSLDDLDAVILSPVFPAGGASAQRPALGIAGFRRLAAAAGRPAYALGGVEAALTDGLDGSGACGIAAIGAIQAAWR